jgi:hypothetical protein
LRAVLLGTQIETLWHLSMFGPRQRRFGIARILVTLRRTLRGRRSLTGRACARRSQRWWWLAASGPDDSFAIRRPVQLQVLLYLLYTLIHAALAGGSQERGCAGIAIGSHGEVAALAWRRVEPGVEGMRFYCGAEEVPRWRVESASGGLGCDGVKQTPMGCWGCSVACAEPCCGVS